jgi:hypothetical protein
MRRLLATFATLRTAIDEVLPLAFAANQPFSPPKLLTSCEIYFDRRF